MDRGLLRTELRNELQETIMKREKTPSVKKFTLLYKASRDGCSVEDFQQKCLEKSPTVTVLYGKSGTIFGGFTSEPWTAGSKMVMKDSSAFLFYCHPNKPMKMLEMDPRDFDWAISCYSEWGPTFGGGYFRNFDLQVFKKVDGKKKIEFKNGYFFLNGSVNFNCTYKSRDKGFTSKSINEGGLCVTDVEVYEVCEDMEGGNDKTQRRLKEESAKRSSRKVAVLAKLRNHIQTVMRRDVFFRPLFQAKKDGCTAEAFHKTCDGRGRTLTIMWGMNNFYGGFTAVNWSSGKRMKKQDKDAFLFCKTIAKNDELIYLTDTKGSQSITCDSNFGPTFGGSLFKGYDFQAFQGNVPPERYEYGYFVANGCVNINNAYSNSEVASSSDFHGGDMTVYDIEVYSVEDEIADFFNDEVDSCKTRISKYCTGQYGVNTYNILVAGQVGAGKTSFCKSVDVAYANKVQHDVGAIAKQTESVTKKISRNTIQRKDGCNIRLYDIRGFEGEKEYSDELEALLDGKLVKRYKFPDEKTDGLSVNYLIDDVNVKPADRIHALCIVIKASSFGIQPPTTIEHLMRIRNMAFDRDIQVTVVATCMDEMCPMVNEDSNAIKKSKVAMDIMESISDTIGVTTDNIFPLINYTTDNVIDDTKSMLALRALAKMVQQADTCIKQNTAEHKVKYVHTLLKFVEGRGLNVLCVGKVNAGKSFFIDSVMSTLSENLSNKASGGILRDTDRTSRGTQKFLWHTLSIKDHKQDSHVTNVKFLDMPGFDNDSAVDLEQIRQVIEGHCPKEYALVNPIDSNADDYIQTPEWHNKAHVVCFVIDDSSLARPDKEIEMLQSIISDILVPKEIPFIIVLTKIDKIGESQDAIAKVSKSFGVKEALVHAVQNYVNEKNVMESIDLSILGVLQAIMEEGVEYYRAHSEDSE